MAESVIGLISADDDALAPTVSWMPAEHSCPGLCAALDNESTVTDAEHDAHPKDTYWMPLKLSFPSAKCTQFTGVALGVRQAQAVPVEIEVRSREAQACRCKRDITCRAYFTGGAGGDVHCNDAAGNVLPCAVQ